MPDRPWSPAYIAAGSNLDDPAGQVRAAFDLLGGIPETRIAAVSRLYLSAPIGPADQPDYVNAVAAVLTRLLPEVLLEALHGIERRRGRRRDGPRWGPRRIDLDLLLHGDTVRNGEALCLPHPGLTQRCFVLRPLADLAPALRLPDGRQVSGLLKHVDCSRLQRL